MDVSMYLPSNLKISPTSVKDSEHSHQFPV